MIEWICSIKYIAAFFADFFPIIEVFLFAVYTIFLNYVAPMGIASFAVDVIAGVIAYIIVVNGVLIIFKVTNPYTLPIELVVAFKANVIARAILSLSFFCVSKKAYRFFVTPTKRCFRECCNSPFFVVENIDGVRCITFAEGSFRCVLPVLNAFSDLFVFFRWSC